MSNRDKYGNPYDWFVEECFCTSLLLGAETFEGVTLDPACGQGNIVNTLIGAGLVAYGTDIVQRTNQDWFVGTLDFLSDDEPEVDFRNIICNPPFYGSVGAEAFIRRALSLASGKVAMFVEQRFLTSSGRSNGIYAEFPPDAIYAISPRPSCPPGQHLLDGGKLGGGKQDFVWLVWDMASEFGETRFQWLRGPSRKHRKKTNTASI